jgi:putative transposase
VIIAVAVNTEGKREIVGLHIGPSEAEIFWSTFLKSLVKRGLRGTKLVISDAHEGLKAAIRRVLGSTWQRCRVHWMRNAQAYVPKGQQNMVSAALRQAFTQLDHPNATQTMRHVADQLRDKWPKLGAFIDDSEADVLAHMNFPAQHRVKIHSTDALDKPRVDGPAPSRRLYAGDIFGLPFGLRDRLGVGFSDQALTNRV